MVDTGRWISLALLLCHVFVVIIIILSHFKVAITLESNRALLLFSYKAHGTPQL